MSKKVATKKQIEKNKPAFSIDGGTVLLEFLFAYSKELHSSDQLALTLYSMCDHMIKRGHDEEKVKKTVNQIWKAVKSGRSDFMEGFMG